MHGAGLPTKADVLAWHMYRRWGYCKVVDGVQEVHIWEDLPSGAYVWDAFYGLDPGNPASSPVESVDDLPMPRFRVAVMEGKKRVWLDWMLGLHDEGGSDDTFAGIPGKGIVDVEFDGGSLGPNGWFTKNMAGNKLIWLTIFYDTPRPEKTGYYAAMYRVHWGGKNPGWGKYEYDDDDGGAGNDKDQLDMIELTIVQCCLL